ncbi:bacillithiol biosynthesis deacetylase BshB1 [Ornithobacterium rhinotracheale]|uniref:bacillithiol biosynthesis deacetylase BshB1 n=1 Tax=Ornithobacterium rhinotracheale TaxID=28251 RepID=UPI003FA4A8E6
MKLDVLATGPHPDDAELGCGGTLAKMAKQGYKVGILDLTQGELGTRGSREIRMEEAKKAGEILGISARENLKMKDGFFVNDAEHQLKIIKIIRKYQPEIVITSAPNDRHIDHARAHELVKNAAFLSGLKKIETGQEPWRPKHIFSYIQWQPLTPDFIVDITGFLDQKIQSCLAYKSQFHDPNSTEPETAISNKNFTESIEYRAKDMGRIIWKDAGEGFIKNDNLGVDNLMAFL